MNYLHFVVTENLPETPRDIGILAIRGETISFVKIIEHFPARFHPEPECRFSKFTYFNKNNPRYGHLIGTEIPPGLTTVDALRRLCVENIMIDHPGCQYEWMD